MSASFIFINERDAPSVAEQPTLEVGCWRVIEAADGHRHLLAVLDSGVVRITSPLTGVSEETGALITRSGRRYVLVFPPETREPQISLLLENAACVGLTGFVDISESLWRSIRDA